MKHTVSYLNCIDHAADRADILERKVNDAAREILDDVDLLVDAVMVGGDEDDSVHLAELRIALGNAAPVLALLFAGDTFDLATQRPASLDAMRKLLRVATESARTVASRVNDAAFDRVNL